MLKDLSLLSSYNVSQLKEGDYLFTTDSNIVYSVYMLNESIYFDAYPEFSADVLTIGFDMIANPLRKTPFDKRVRVTISNIIINYLDEHPEKVFFFVCDSADTREKSRMRIFELWYNQRPTNAIEKHNESILTADMDIYCSIIIHSKNHLRNHILSCFHMVTRSTTEKLKSY
jgi:hypothetical protein